jgi:hypothetical protein
MRECFFFKTANYRALVKQTTTCILKTEPRFGCGLQEIVIVIINADLDPNFTAVIDKQRYNQNHYFGVI